MTVSGFELSKEIPSKTLAKPCDLALKNGASNTYLFLDHMKTGIEKNESVKEHTKSEIKTLNNKKWDDAAILFH